MPDHIISAGFTALDRFALAVVIGVAATGWWLLVDDNDRRTLSTGFSRLLGIALACLAITSVIILIMRSAVMADVPPSEALPFIPRVLTHSEFGVLWILRMITLCALVTILFRLRHRASILNFALVAVCAALLSFLVSSGGHAADDGSLTFANAVNWLHITAGCLWGGTVIAYASVVLPPLLRDSKTQAMKLNVASTATRLSTLAGSALLIVVITGILNAWRQLTLVSDLWSSDYGLILSGKVAVVAVMAGIGAMNRFVVVPAIETWADAHSSPSGPQETSAPYRFLKVLRLDTFIFALIIVCAAVLGMQAPPYHEDAAHYSLPLKSGFS